MEEEEDVSILVRDGEAERGGGVEQSRYSTSPGGASRTKPDAVSIVSATDIVIDKQTRVRIIGRD